MKSAHILSTMALGMSILATAGTPDMTRCEEGTPRSKTDRSAAGAKGEKSPPDDAKSHAVYASYRCVAADDGKPLADAEVQFHVYRAKPSRANLWKTAPTDLDGNVTFEGKLPAAETDAISRAQVCVRVPGRATRILYYQAMKKGDPPIELTIEPASSLKGRVVDASGMGVSGAVVYVGVPHLRGVNDAVSDKDGNFVIADLEAWVPMPEPPTARPQCFSPG